MMVPSEPRYTLGDIIDHSKWLYSVELSEQEAESIHEKLSKLAATGGGWASKSKHAVSYGTSAGVAIWLKSRLSEIGKMKVEQQQSSEIRCVTEMHVFFLNIEETEEQIDLLRNVEPVKSDSPSRSKLHAYMQQKAVLPIDRTAFNVAPPPEEVPE